MTLKQKLSNLLFEAWDISSLVVFRVAFGAILFWEVVRHFQYDWIRAYWIEPDFYFSYEWFEWLKPWGGQGMIFHFYLLGILSILIMVGLFYRLATVLLFFAFSYLFLLEQTTYLNHFYLVLLISFLMIFIPAHKKYSLDALFWKRIKSDWVPAWTIILLQFQIGVAYFFGGLAKMNYDWLILAEPMQHWLAQRTDFPIIGQIFYQAWTAYVMSWAGFLLDLLAPFLLILRRPRPYMFGAILLFHLMNDRLFQIGIFPWFMILATTIFFPSDWFKQFINEIKENQKHHREIILVTTIIFALIGIFMHPKSESKNGFEFIPFLVAGLGGAILAWLFIQLEKPAPANKKTIKTTPLFARNADFIVLIIIWGAIQLLLPLRHYLIEGNVSWTEEGHRFSWHMMLRSKTGITKFSAYDPMTRKTEEIDPNKYLTEPQYTQMTKRPVMILQFAKYLQRKLKEEGKGNCEIRVKAYVRLNYRPYRLMINPNIDLAKESSSDFRHNDWILQLDENLAPKPISIEERMRNFLN